MDIPDGHAPVYRTTVDLLLEAESPEDALLGLDALAGTEVSVEGERVFVEEVQSVEGEPIDPASYGGDGLLLYPSRARIAVLADELWEAERILARLNGGAAEDEDGYEISIDLTDSPIEAGTMPEPPEEELAPPGPSISISPRAHRFIWDHGCSVYVWGKPFGGGFASLSAETAHPLGTDFELHSEIDVEGRTVSVYLQEGLPASILSIRLRRFPRTKLDVQGLVGGDGGDGGEAILLGDGGDGGGAGL